MTRTSSEEEPYVKGGQFDRVHPQMSSISNARSNDSHNFDGLSSKANTMPRNGRADLSRHALRLHTAQWKHSLPRIRILTYMAVFCENGAFLPADVRP